MTLISMVAEPTPITKAWSISLDSGVHFLLLCRQLTADFDANDVQTISDLQTFWPDLCLT